MWTDEILRISTYARVNRPRRANRPALVGTAAKSDDVMVGKMLVLRMRECWDLHRGEEALYVQGKTLLVNTNGPLSPAGENI